MNFKKHISIVLASLILLANLGLSFAVHYCKDEIASISFQLQEEEPCVKDLTACCAKVATHDACCSNKIIKVEKKTDNILVKKLQFDLDASILVSNWQPKFFVNSKNIDATNEVAFYCDSHAPPLYKLHCQLVFYA